MLVRNLAFSFDPTQRGWMSMDTYIPAIPLGQTMKAGTVGQVVESRRPGFAKGDLVQGLFGWEDYTVSGGEGLMGLQKLPAGTDPILALSLLGTTGLTAYFGTLAVGAVKSGETFVVSGAAGATGSVSGMIAKIKGCRVVGIAGGREKCDWLLKRRASTPRLIIRMRMSARRWPSIVRMVSTCTLTTSAARSSIMHSRD